MWETWGLILGLESFPGEGKSYPLQYSGLVNSMDCIVHRVAKSHVLNLSTPLQLLLVQATITSCLDSCSCLPTTAVVSLPLLIVQFTHYSSSGSQQHLCKIPTRSCFPCLKSSNVFSLCLGKKSKFIKMARKKKKKLCYLVSIYHFISHHSLPPPLNDSHVWSSFCSSNKPSSPHS